MMFANLEPAALPTAIDLALNSNVGGKYAHHRAGPSRLPDLDSMLQAPARLSS